MKLILKMAWRNVWRNKRRSMITLASIGFAVFFAVLMRSMQLGTYERLIQTMVKNTTGYVRLQHPDFEDEPTIDNSISLGPELFNSVKGVEGVQGLLPRIDGFSLAAYGNKTKGVNVQGFVPSLEGKSLDLESKLVEGELFNDGSKTAVIAQGVAKYLDLSVGDTIVLLGQGYHSMTAAGKYEVEGIVKYPNPAMNNGFVHLPLSEAQWFYSAGDHVTSVLVDIEDARKHNRIQEDLLTVVDTSMVSVLRWEQVLPEVVQTIEADSAGGIMMIFILYMVISFGILGTVIMMTNDRKYEFGVLISVGFKRIQLTLVVFFEVLLLGLLGVVAGNLLAYPIMVYYYHYPIQLGGDMASYLEQIGWEAVLMFSKDPSILWAHGLLILCVSLVISLYPTLKIKWLKPVEAMRS